MENHPSRISSWWVNTQITQNNACNESSSSKVVALQNHPPRIPNSWFMLKPLFFISLCILRDLPQQKIPRE
jgi:hypothetical protein